MQSVDDAQIHTHEVWMHTDIGMNLRQRELEHHSTPAVAAICCLLFALCCYADSIDSMAGLSDWLPG